MYRHFISFIETCTHIRSFFCFKLFCASSALAVLKCFARLLQHLSLCGCENASTWLLNVKIWSKPIFSRCKNRILNLENYGESIDFATGLYGCSKFNFNRIGMSDSAFVLVIDLHFSFISKHNQIRFEFIFRPLTHFIVCVTMSLTCVMNDKQIKKKWKEKKPNKIATEIIWIE